MDKILIVNNIETDRAGAAAVLSQRFEVLEADSQAAAEEIMSRHRGEIGAVLVSAYLPGESGLDLLAELCLCGEGVCIPVLAETLEDDGETIKRALDIGAYDCVTKPYSAPLVLRRTEQAFRLWKAQTEARRAKKSVTEAETIIENAEAAIYVCDAQSYRILYVNDRGASLCGGARGEVAGQICYEALMGETRPCIHCPMQSDEELHYSELEQVREKDGISRLFKSKAVDWHGQKAYIIYATDVTAHMQERKRIKDLMNDVPAGMGIVEVYPDGRISVPFLNDAYYAGLGAAKATRGQYVDYAFRKAIFPEDDYRLISDIKLCSETGEPVKSEFRVMTNEGRYVWVRTSSRRVFKSDEKSVLLTMVYFLDSVKRSMLQLAVNEQVLDLADIDRNISVWFYDINNRRVVQDDLIREGYRLPRTMENLRESAAASRLVMPEDRESFKAAYDKIEAGADRSQCVVRLYNWKTNTYEWQRIVISRIRDRFFEDETALCVAINVDSQYNTRIRFEHELQIRKSLLKDAEVYFEINLTSNTVVEYQSKQPAPEGPPKKGAQGEAVFGRMLMKVVEEDRERVSEKINISALKDAYKNGERFRECTYRRLMDDGSVRWYTTSVSIVSNPDMNEAVALFFLKDINNEVMSRKAMDSVLAEEIETVVMVDVHTGMSRLLRGEDKLWGIQRGQKLQMESMSARYFCFRVVKEDAAVCSRFFNTYSLSQILEETSPAELTYRVREPDGSVSRKRAMAFFLDERHANIVITRRDITRLYEEEQRQRLLLQKAVDEANHANKAKSDFLSRMSHDMRTPLNAVLGLTALSKKERNTPKTDEYLTQIDASGRFLLSLISDLLDIDRIESGKIELNDDSFSLEALETNVNTVIAPLMEKKGVRFCMDLRCGAKPFRTDKMRYCQIFFNLLSNAMKYTDVGGHVEFTAKLLGEDAQKRQGIRYIVRDNGRGMSEEFQKKAFEPFTQEGAGSNGEVAGSGLGLAIVKRLMNAFGGKMAVSSRLGEGSEFVVEIFSEVDEESVKAERNEEVDLEALKGLRILVVDDQKMNILVAQGLLESEGSLVETAESGQECIDKFIASKEGHYDAILMDVRMPGMNGMEATGRIRRLARPDAESVPIIALTGDAIQADKEAQLEAGMNVSLSKPVEPRLLYKTILELTRK